MLMLLVVVVLLFLVVGGLPRWGYSQGWGYGPSSLGGILLLILVVWLLLGHRF